MNRNITLKMLSVPLLLLLATAPLFWRGAMPTAVAQSSVTCTTDVIVQAGDTLSVIAGRVYGNPTAYATIVEATNAKAATDASYATIANANLLQIGWKLCVPGAVQTAASTGAQPAATQPTAAPDSTNAAPATTPIPITTQSVTASQSVTVTRAVTSALAPGELHPLTIERMRQESYPGSDIVIEQVLDPGVNYNRYIASYLSEGNKIYALLTVPQGQKPATGWPVVIFNHGYIPPEQYRTTERYVAYVDAFARNGYIVFRSDYRGHGFSEGEAAGGYGSPAYTIDVLNAVASIKRYADADPNRIGMWGHSMGGQITLRAMVVSKDIKAGVIWAGVVGSYPDLLENWRRPSTSAPPPVTSGQSRRWRDELISTYGTPAENPEFWASISPNSYLTDLTGPIQLHHGTADTSVPILFSEKLKAEIEAVGGTVEYYSYPGDDHNIAANLATALARSVAFFDLYVKAAP